MASRIILVHRVKAMLREQRADVLCKGIRKSMEIYGILLSEEETLELIKRAQKDLREEERSKNAEK